MVTNLVLSIFTLDSLYKAFTILSPFITLLLAYLFGILGKRKDIELETEKQLNRITSSLLKVWFQLTRVDMMIKDISNNESSSSKIIPAEFIPMYIFNSKILDKNSFVQLDEDIEPLKSFDPATYFYLEGLGRRNQHFHDEFVLPILSKPQLGDTMIVASATPIVQELLDEFEISLEMVVKLLRRRKRGRVKKLLKDYSKRQASGEVNKMEKEYFELVKQMIPGDQAELSFEDFREKLLNEPSFRKELDEKVKYFLSSSFKDLLDTLSEDENDNNESTDS